MHELDVETGSEESRNGLSLQPFFVFFNDDAKALQNELFAKKSEYWLIKSNSREQKTSWEKSNSSWYVHDARHLFEHADEWTWVWDIVSIISWTKQMLKALR